MKKSAITLLHVAYWTIYFALWFIVIAAISQSAEISDEDAKYYAGVVIGIAITPAIISFYVFYYLLFPKYLQKRQIPQTIIASLLVAFGTFPFAALTLYFTADMGLSCYAQSNYLGVLIVAFISLVNGIVAYVIKGFVTWFEEVKMKEELLKKNHEMEMALVKSQLDPHFLFNTLNNIDILIIKDPKEASAYLNKLSDIMRFTLFEAKTEEISLERELTYIEKFIELQKIRTNNKDYVNYEVKGNAKNKKVAPMVFMPFIENAFKHSNNKKLENAIDIKFDITDDSITMKCENKIDPNRSANIESNGLGNKLITKRLNLIYPGKHILDILKSKTTYKIALKLDYASV